MSLRFVPEFGGLGGRSEASRKMKKLLSEEYPGRIVHVCTDLELTLEATGEGPAIVLVAGTGSAAVGRDERGRSRESAGMVRFWGMKAARTILASVPQLRHFGRRIGPARPPNWGQGS